jgi:hypothetical protein
MPSGSDFLLKTAKRKHLGDTAIDLIKERDRNEDREPSEKSVSK